MKRKILSALFCGLILFFPLCSSAVDNNRGNAQSSPSKNQGVLPSPSKVSMNKGCHGDKDYLVVIPLSHSFEFDGEEIREALVNTFLQMKKQEFSHHFRFILLEPDNSILLDWNSCEKLLQKEITQANIENIYDYSFNTGIEALESIWLLSEIPVEGIEMNNIEHLWYLAHPQMMENAETYHWDYLQDITKKGITMEIAMQGGCEPWRNQWSNDVKCTSWDNPENLSGLLTPLLSQLN